MYAYLLIYIDADANTCILSGAKCIKAMITCVVNAGKEDPKYVTLGLVCTLLRTTRNGPR